MDIFSGTSSVGYSYKSKYRVYANDCELYAYIIAKALLSSYYIDFGNIQDEFLAHYNENLKNQYGEKIDFLPYGTRAKLFTYIFKYFYLCLKTIYFYFKLRPKVIVTTGTHTAGPMCYLGKIFGSKIIYIETFANKNKKTATGRLIYPIADLFIVQWEEMLKLYPKAIYGGSIY